MKYTRHNFVLFVFLTAIFLAVRGYPVTNTDDNLLIKDEKRYPNGTIVGKYTYTDKEGNPIHVKYYADDASYGVELKSVKIMNSDSAPLRTEKLLNYPLQITDHPFESVLDHFTGFKEHTFFNKNFTNEPLQLYKDKAKSDKKNNVEFEILLQNELKAPEKCGKEKVKVYFDKDKRKTRNIASRQDSMKYCNRF